MAAFSERRRAQRVDANLKLKVSVPVGSDSTLAANLQTINISTSGAYFLTDHFIAPMTKLALGLELTVAGPAGAPPDLALVQCEGLVVRSEPEQPTPGQDSYEIAVFFTAMEPEAARILEEHINLLMTAT